MVKVRFLGHAAFYVESSGLKALIDPFLRGNPQGTATPEDFPEISHIFLTHGHGDHLGDTVEIACRTGATVVSNFEICNILGEEGLQVHPMHIGGAFRFPFGQVKMTPALHGSSITLGEQTLYGGNPGGFLLELEGGTLYHAGDTGLTMDMQLLEPKKIDLALLPIGGNFVMDAEDAARAVQLLCPRKVVPMHYDTFDMIRANPGEFARLVGNVAEVLILQPGEQIEF